MKEDWKGKGDARAYIATAYSYCTTESFGLAATV